MQNTKNLRDELLEGKTFGKRQVLKIKAWVGADQQRYDELVNLFLGDEYRVTQRAAWLVSDCAMKNKGLIQPHLPRIIKNLENPNLPDAVKRNTVRILQFMPDVPEELLGSLADSCFRLLAGVDEPIAVKAFSMTVLLNIAKKYPDIKNELKLLIEEQIDHGSTGFKNRGNKTLQALEKI